jgi:predicted HTH domain antitoxin
MSEMVPIEIPKEILHVTRMTKLDLRRELAVALFQQNKLSFGKARELAEMTVWDFQQLLATRKIDAHYNTDAYQRDLTAIEELGL